jgi:hypothetical protein
MNMLSQDYKDLQFLSQMTTNIFNNKGVLDNSVYNYIIFGGLQIIASFLAFIIRRQRNFEWKKEQLPFIIVNLNL